MKDISNAHANGGKKPPLKWKIFTFLLGFCALLLVTLWLMQTVFLDDMYKLIRTNEINKAVKQVEQNINSPELSTLLQQLMQSKEIMVTTTDNFSPMAKQPEQRGHPKQETITKTREFTLENGSIISLTFHAIITPVYATVATLQAQLYIITGIMIAFSVILAMLIAHRVARPIEDINRSAKVLARGSYDTHFDSKGYLEIAELSDTLNTAASELSKVEGLRRELMANISHDLRTPLSLIYSYSEMMHDFPNEITPDQTRVIMEETQRLTSLVNDVFEISKLESGIQTLTLTRFDITARIQSTIERMEHLLAKEGYSFCFESGGAVIVSADEVKIMQVFYNLLINAVNYAGEDKHITVRQRVSDATVCIEIADNGDGIGPDKLAHIWDRYYKVDKAHKRAVTGTGLGLSIVKKMMELHRPAALGQEPNYGVESTPGQGSTFWFILDRSI